MSLVAWDRPHFKHDEPSRHDDAKARKAAEDVAWRKVCALVDARDGRQCRCCDKRSDPEATGLTKRGHRHHIVYRSAGGKDEAANLLTLCAACHSSEHRNGLRFTAEGGPYVGLDANQPMEFWRKDDDGRWYLSRREVAVGRPEKD